MLAPYKSWKKCNEFQLTKNKMDLNTWKWKTIHPLPSEESHPVTDPLRNTVDETGDSLSLPNLNTIIIKKSVIFYKKSKKYNEIQLIKNKMDINIRKMTNHPPSPEVNIWLKIFLYMHFCSLWALTGCPILLALVQSNTCSVLWHWKQNLGPLPLMPKHVLAVLNGSSSTVKTS